jgi:hypothetical protein
MLRRKQDYAFPNRRAEVFVAEAQSGQPAWKPAGVGAIQHIVQTSNRRFRDYEFLLPLALIRAALPGLPALGIGLE